MRKLLLTSALVCAMATPILAQSGQGAPPDVPKDHWAHKAVDELFRAGLLKGYPDGTFKGNRPASRYEMAGVLNSLHSMMTGKISELKPVSQSQGNAEADDLLRQIRALHEQVKELRRQVETDLPELKTRYARIGDEIRRLRGEIGESRKSVDDQKKKID